MKILIEGIIQNIWRLLEIYSFPTDHRIKFGFREIYLNTCTFRQCKEKEYFLRVLDKVDREGYAPVLVVYGAVRFFHIASIVRKILNGTTASHSNSMNTVVSDNSSEKRENSLELISIRCICLLCKKPG